VFKTLINTQKHIIKNMLRIETFYNKLERFIDKIIPYTIIILLFIIIRDLFFHEFLIEYEHYIQLIDEIIIGIFIIDLIFKYKHTKTFRKFLKTSWLDILAVFPFYIILRFVEEIIIIFRFSETLETSQKLLHETIIVSEESGKIIKELEKTGKLASRIEQTGELSRIRLFTRIFRPFQRIPRLIKGIAFYEKPIKKAKNKLIKEIKK